MCKKINVIIVTYGNRVNQLHRVIECLVENKIHRIIIVDNDSSFSTKDYLRNMAESHTNISIVESPRNLGSAGGYELGIINAMDAEYLWLLDDDNVPLDNALEMLISHVSNQDKENNILQSVKVYPKFGDSDLRERSFVHPSRSSFCEFHIIDLPRKISRRLSRLSPEHRTSAKVLPYTAYSGLFIPVSAISEVGLPNPAFFLYCDDTEYTFRLISAGWRIDPISESKIVDIGEYWGGNHGISQVFSRFLSTDKGFRPIYTARNQIYFDYHFWSTNRLVYQINKLIFMCVLFVIAIWRNKLAEYLRFFKYLQLGEAGILGEITNLSIDEEIL